MACLVPGFKSRLCAAWGLPSDVRIVRLDWNKGGRPDAFIFSYQNELPHPVEAECKGLVTEQVDRFRNLFGREPRCITGDPRAWRPGDTLEPRGSSLRGSLSRRRSRTAGQAIFVATDRSGQTRKANIAGMGEVCFHPLAVHNRRFQYRSLGHAAGRYSAGT
jgi:hypothetical protein